MGAYLLCGEVLLGHLNGSVVLKLWLVSESVCGRSGLSGAFVVLGVVWGVRSHTKKMGDEVCM